MIKVEYSSNNSGGRWWLSDTDWRNLENEGWKVNWFKAKPSGIIRPDKDGRWLGALATSATKRFTSIHEAVAEFARITGKTLSDEGCNCCGPPHYFNWHEDGTYMSAGGTELEEYMENKPTLSRYTDDDLLDELNRRRK